MTLPELMTAAWPELHARVEVFGPWHERWLPSLLEDRDGRDLLVAVPNAPGTIVPVVGRPGELLTLQWVNTRGAAEVECRLVEVARNALASWRLLGLGEPVVRQRRAYVRAEVRIPVTLVDEEGGLAGWVVDLSEGGARVVRVADRLELEDQPLQLQLQLEIEGRDVLVQGEVLRVDPDHGGSPAVAVKFLDLHDRDADRIRRFVFRSQLRTTERSR